MDEEEEKADSLCPEDCRLFRYIVSLSIRGPSVRPRTSRRHNNWRKNEEKSYWNLQQLTCDLH